MNWLLSVLEAEGSTPIADFPVLSEGGVCEASGLRLSLEVTQESGYQKVKAVVHSQEPRCVMFSLASEPVAGARLWNFDGSVEQKEIYRQSPHDVDAWVIKGIARQSVPLVAVQEGQHFHVALNGSASLYGNACSQSFDPESGVGALRSGDDGATPGLKPSEEDVVEFAGLGFAGQRFSPGRVIEHFYEIDAEQLHAFEFLLLTVEGDSLEQLRSSVYRAVDNAFAPEVSSGQFGALAFVTAWMNLRVNDSGKSRYWVVPAAEYSNIQYNRDAFWIATMLEPEMDRECLLHELAEIDSQAEYPLYTMIWAQRVVQAGGALPKERLQACLDVILGKARDNWYYAFTEKDGRHDFQYWQDSMAYASDDVIAYNQGLFAVALQVADSLGLDLRTSSASEAVRNYCSMFCDERGYLPTSQMKSHLLSPDSLVPDLLANIYLGAPLLPRESVAAHIETLNRVALTPHGYKVLCRNNGDYPTEADTTIEGYRSESQRAEKAPGDYQRGGSWFLYDCVCLLDGVLHEVPTAAQLLVWRIRMEMDAYGTTFEYLHTKTGQPHKSNMGWNVAIYAFLRQLTAEERISPQILQQIEATAL